LSVHLVRDLEMLVEILAQSQFNKVCAVSRRDKQPQKPKIIGPAAYVQISILTVLNDLKTGI